MPAAKKRPLVERGHYKAADIMTILNISKSKAYDIIHDCEAYGIVFKDKGTYRVEIAGFNQYCDNKKMKELEVKARLDKLVKDGTNAIQQHRRGRPRKEVCA